MYRVEGCGKIVLKNGEEIRVDGKCIILLKGMDIECYECEGLVWEE